MDEVEVLSFLASNPVVGIGGGMLAALIAWATVVLVTNSKRWHERHHAEQAKPFGCDHCMKAWLALD